MGFVTSFAVKIDFSCKAAIGYHNTLMSLAHKHKPSWVCKQLESVVISDFGVIVVVTIA